MAYDSFYCPDRSAADSLDIRAGIGDPNSTLKLVHWWVSPSVLEVGSGFSIDCSCTDVLGNASTDTGGVGDGNSAVGKSGIFFFYCDASSPFTFDVGYFSPLGIMRYDYRVIVSSAPGLA
jgi:hypothetical protein